MVKKDSRVFNGKRYSLVTHYFRKSEAQVAQGRLKQGSYTRITKELSKMAGGHYIYFLWARPREMR